MTIRTLQVYEYKETIIYIRNFGEVFEYILAWKGEVYTSHIVAKKLPWQRWLGKDYTTKQLTDTTRYMLMMGESVVDSLLEQK